MRFDGRGPISLSSGNGYLDRDLAFRCQRYIEFPGGTDHLRTSLMTKEEPMRPSDDVPQTAEALLPLVYEELKKLASHRMAHELKEHTLQATALVHEAYLRLVGDGEAEWANRGHFFSAAAQAMRRILIEHARTKGRKKRVGKRRRVPLGVLDLAVEADPHEILALDDAICRLKQQFPDQAEVVKLRFYGGLSEHEVSESLGIAISTVARYWRFARAWLYRELEDPQ